MQVQLINQNLRYNVSQNKKNKDFTQSTKISKNNPKFTSKLKLPKNQEHAVGCLHGVLFTAITMFACFGNWIHNKIDESENKEFVEQGLFMNNLPAENLETMGVTAPQFNNVKEIITKQLNTNLGNDTKYYYKGIDSYNTIRFTDGVESFDFIFDKEDNSTEFSELNIPEIDGFSIKVTHNNDGFSIITDFADKSNTLNFTKDGALVLNNHQIFSNSSTDKFVTMLELQEKRQDLQTKLEEKNKEYEMLSLALETIHGNKEAKDKLYKLIEEQYSDSKNTGYGAAILGLLIASGGYVWIAAPLMLGGILVPQAQIENELKEMTKAEIKQEIILKMNTLENEISKLENDIKTVSFEIQDIEV